MWFGITRFVDPSDPNDRKAADTVAFGPFQKRSLP